MEDQTTDTQILEQSEYPNRQVSSTHYKKATEKPLRPRDGK